MKHSSDSRIALSDLVQLNQNEIILYKIKPPSDDISKLRIHGAIMSFTWILIASTGILISRYFKMSWANYFICGKAGWFTAHRFLMSITAILTILGFLFVLAFTGGTWVDKGPTRVYAHSITGVLVISLAFFQPFVALFRCEPESPNRFMFNYIHLFFGFSAFTLSIATLFLATYFEIFGNHKARSIIILWVIWILFIFTAFELIQSYFRKKSGHSSYSNINASNTETDQTVESLKSSTSPLTDLGNERQSLVEDKIKNILLAIHILFAAILSIVMTTYIYS